MTIFLLCSSTYSLLAAKITCRCDNSEKRKDSGQCRKSISKVEDINGDYVCYVEEPSNCKDLMYSRKESGHDNNPKSKISSEACKNGSY